MFFGIFNFEREAMMESKSIVEDILLTLNKGSLSTTICMVLMWRRWSSYSCDGVIGC
jgi:hypothetical protein